MYLVDDELIYMSGGFFKDMNMGFKVGVLLYFGLLFGLNSVALPDVRKKSYEVDELNATAGELLLELMIRIATYPRQWNRIHQMLGNVNRSSKFKNSWNDNSKAILSLINRSMLSMFINRQQKQDTFEDSFRKAALQHLEEKFKIYPKTFTYHRIKGRPIASGKTPMTYIAVSVITPKYTISKFQEELVLEKELQKLKTGIQKKTNKF